MKRTLLTCSSVLAVIALLGVLSVAVLAHNHLEKTMPTDGASLTTAPDHVELWFAEKPDLAVTKLDAMGPSGMVDLGPVHVIAKDSIGASFKAKLAGGKYVVNWQTAGDDGHVSKGDFSFSVTSAH